MGAVQILTHSMVQSIEENSVRKGYDPRDFALVAEGGAGPLFAAQIALEVGTPWVLVPPHPGITSAMGLLATDMVYEYVSTAYQRLSQLDAAALQRQFEELEGRARAQLEEDGIPAESMVIQRVADCRYLGQGYELRVDVESGAIDEAWGERVRASFHDIHEREYSRRFEESDIEIPNVRVRGIGRMPRLSTPEVEKGPESPEAALRYERDAWFRVRGELAQVPTRYYERSALKAGNRLDGPAIVNQYDSTTVIPPEVSAHVDGFGNIVIATGVPARDGRAGAGGDRMSAAEYEVGRQPGPPTRKRVEVDPITLRVLGGAFHATAKEMAGVLFRMSYSSIIRESEDLGAGIFDAQGRELCESDSTPMHIGSLPWYIRGFLHRLEGTIEDGDVIVHNHPYLGASHSPDVAVAVPIFHEGELLGFAAVTAHVLDVGGSFPGINADAFDVYAEAKLYNALRWYRRGELQRGPRPDDLRQRPHRDHEPRRHERDARRVPARQGALPPARRPLRRRGRHERRVRLDGLLRADAPERDREDPRRHVRAGGRLARRRRPHPRRAAAGGDARDRRGRRDHDRPDGVEPGGADGLQRAVRGLAARLVLLRRAHDPPRRGDVPRARAAERRCLPAGQGDRAQGDDLQPDLPARVLLALLPDPARRRQHQPRARRRAPGQGHGRQLGRHPLLRLCRLRRGGGGVLALPRGERGRVRRPVRQGRDGLGRQPDGEHAQQPDRGAGHALPDAVRPVRAAPGACGAREVARRGRDHPPQPLPGRRHLLLRGRPPDRSAAGASSAPGTGWSPRAARTRTPPARSSCRPR